MFFHNIISIITCHLLIWYVQLLQTASSWILNTVIFTIHVSQDQLRLFTGSYCCWQNDSVPSYNSFNEICVLIQSRQSAYSLQNLYD